MEAILVAEDDADIAELVALYLNSDGFQVTTAENGVEALEQLKNGDFAVLLADIMMPQMNGYELIREVRAFSDIPIIVISAKASDADRVLGLNIGADAYIPKPFNPLEVTAYVKAVLRRRTMNTARESVAAEVLRVGNLEFDCAKYVLRKNGELMPLTVTELKIVCMMMEAPEQVFTKGQIYERIGGNCYLNDENTVMVHISNIRAKIEDDPSNPRYIKTIRGLGYKLEK